MTEQELKEGDVSKLASLQECADLFNRIKFLRESYFFVPYSEYESSDMTEEEMHKYKIKYHSTKTLYYVVKCLEEVQPTIKEFKKYKETVDCVEVKLCRMEELKND